MGIRSLFRNELIVKYDDGIYTANEYIDANNCIYYIMLVNRGQKINFKLNLMTYGSLDIKFIGITNRIDIKYSKTLINLYVIKKFLEVQYIDYVNNKHNLSFEDYTNTKPQLKDVISFLNYCI